MVGREKILSLKRSDNTIAREDIVQLAIEKFTDSWEFDRCNKGNGTVTKAYPFSNENLTALFQRIDCKGKRVATVGSSLDQALNAVFNDAEYVTVMDANVYTLPFGEYKRAVIQTTEFNEFEEFLIEPRNMMTRRIAGKAMEVMPNDARKFWEHVIEDHDNFLDWYYFSIKRHNGVQIIGKDVYQHEINSPFYKEKKAYHQLRDKLAGAKIDYVLSEMSDFSRDINGVYDVILLSNICKYVSEQKFYGDGGLRGLYYNHLADDGIMQLHSILGNYDGFDTTDELVTAKTRDIERNLKLYHIGGKIEQCAMNGKNYSILLNKTPEMEA